MSYTISKYLKENEEQVKNFNKRLKVAGRKIKFPESCIPNWLPKEKSKRIFQEYYLCFDGDLVRGGYILKRQEFCLNGQTMAICDYQFPISEGIIDCNYSDVALFLTKNATNMSPNLMAMGMGGFNENLPKLLKALKWSINEVPFYFRIENPNNLLLKFKYIRKKRINRILLGFLAYSGLGWIAHKIFYLLQNKCTFSSNINFKIVDEFDHKIDTLWNAEGHEYKFIAVRDAVTLNILYPIGSKRFHKLEVYKDNNFIGWVVLLATSMKDHKQFGDLRVGTIVVAFAYKKYYSEVIYCCADFFKNENVDIIIVNHSHKIWKESLKKHRFLAGPSNYLFASSRNLSREFNNNHVSEDEIFIMRADGDGPIHL